MSTKTIYLELFGTVNIYFGLGVQIVTALILGGMIGYDREKKMKSAGIKTNILICLGSTIYTALSLINISNFEGVSDPNRITAQIVTGIGFLGAGAIIRGGGGVIGLTTAASMWVVAAIGMTIGIGYPVIAAMFTVTILVVLKLLGPLYVFMESHSKDCMYRYQVLSHGSVKNYVRDVVLSTIGNIKEFKEEIVGQNNEKALITFYVTTKPMSAEQLVKTLKTNIKIKDVTHIKAIEELVPNMEKNDV